jgi:hypothetical protein
MGDSWHIRDDAILVQQKDWEGHFTLVKRRRLPPGHPHRASEIWEPHINLSLTQEQKGISPLLAISQRNSPGS